MMKPLRQRHPYYQMDWVAVPKDTRDYYRQLARTMARQLLQPGDRILAARCGGWATFTFAGWDGHGIVSASGINDISPLCVLRHNGRDVAWWQARDEQFIELAMNRTNANAPTS